MTEGGATSGIRVSTILLCAILILSVLFFVHIPKASASPDEWTEWSYDDFVDTFDLGNHLNVQLNGQPGGDGNITLDNYIGWYDMAPSNNPGKRDLFGFAFDGKNRVAVLFGGFLTGEGVKNDTWEYDFGSNTWTRIIDDGSPGSPPRRDYCQMDYDSVNEVIVLWGGADDAGNKLTDTWEYDVNTKTWTETHPKPSPPGIGGYALAYDSKYSKILVAGTSEMPPGGTIHLWSYDAGADTWAERTPTPYPRAGHDMAFDGNKMVLQGGGWGMMGEIKYDDTLWYDYGTDSWTRINYEGDPLTPRPGYRVGNAMARHYNGVFDVNGDGDALYPNNSWESIGTGWHDRSPLVGNPHPDERKSHRMVWDSHHEALILYGGYCQGIPRCLGIPGRMNDTWVYGEGYAPAGFYVSKSNGEYYFDSGSVTTEWLRIWWNHTPSNQPLNSTLKFQLQSGNLSDPKLFDPDRTHFVGPGNSNSTYYDTPGQLITNEHRWHRYIRYQGFLEGNPANTPVFDDITIAYDPEGPPFVENTDPVNDEIDVSIWKNITIEFNEPMDTGTVTWTINPDPGGWTEGWSGGNTILTLKHSNPLEENVKHMVTVTGGKDLDGLDLIDPYDLNPWNFTVICIKPWLESTNPYDSEADVELSRNIVVRFNEPMNHNTVTWIVSPSSPPHPPLAGYSVEWGSSNTTLFLNHTTPYQECQQYLAMIIGGKDLKGNSLDPSKGVENPWMFFSFCDRPYVTNRDPEHGTQNVPLDKNVIITFSEPMNTGTVTWYVDTNKDGPGLDLGWSWVWESGNTVLNISHTVTFTENTLHWVNVTYGEDLFGNQLIRTVGMPRWWFRTEIAIPWIISTDPYDGETGVPTNKDVIITFSEPIETSTFLCQISPNPGGLIWNWILGNTVAIGSHNPFSSLTDYTVNIINAKDMHGNPLDSSKGAPNPWSFTTGLGPPGDLRVLRSPPDIIIQWDIVPGATEYRVYESTNRFAWPWPLRGTVIPPATQYTHAGAHDDGLTHFYLVRAYKGVEESPNSTMGAKAHRTILMASGPQVTDINWISLPFNSIYKKASDIANELKDTKIRVVGKWLPSKQKAVTYTFAKGKWKGKDFSINPGDGIFIAGIQKNFNWIITGTDLESTLSYTHYPKFAHNINWISIPYTGIYSSASSVIIDIEGGLVLPTKITEIGKWNPLTQTSTKFYWAGAGWMGTDFSIAPGDGIYIKIITSFSWPIILLTPTIP